MKFYLIQKIIIIIKRKKKEESSPWRWVSTWLYIMTTLLAMGACDMFPHSVLCSYPTFFRPSILSATYRGQHMLVTSEIPQLSIARGMDDIIVSCSIAITGERMLAVVVQIITPECNRTKAMWIRNAKEFPFVACAWIEVHNINVLWRQHLKLWLPHLPTLESTRGFRLAVNNLIYIWGDSSSYLALFHAGSSRNPSFLPILTLFVVWWVAPKAPSTSCLCALCNIYSEHVITLALNECICPMLVADRFNVIVSSYINGSDFCHVVIVLTDAGWTWGAPRLRDDSIIFKFFLDILWNVTTAVTVFCGWKLLEAHHSRHWFVPSVDLRRLWTCSKVSSGFAKTMTKSHSTQTP